MQIQLNGQVEYAEVQFYFLKFADNSEELVPRALVSVYSRPIQELLEESFNELWACDYKGTDNLQVIETSCILSVVSLQPLPPLPGEPDNRWFVTQKSGLDDVQLTGYEEPMDDGIAGNVGGDDIDSGEFM